MSDNQPQTFPEDVSLVAKLLEYGGFRLARGMCHDGETERQTLVVTRPDTPEWGGIFTMRLYEDESRDAISAAAYALETWERVREHYQQN